MFVLKQNRSKILALLKADLALLIYSNKVFKAEESFVL